MKNLFFCLRCPEISISDERLYCSNCENDESWTATEENFNFTLPEPENASPGCNVPASYAGKPKSEDILPSVESTRQVNNQMFEEVCNISSQNDVCHGRENCSKSDGPFQNTTSKDFYQYNTANKNRLEANSNTNQGEFHVRSFDIYYDTTSMRELCDTSAESQQPNLHEQSSIGECENKNNGDELISRQGTIEGGIKSDRFIFTDSVTLESQYPTVNSSENVEDRQDKENVPPPFSVCPRGNTSMIKNFQENSVTEIGMARQSTQTSNKLSNRRCKNCGKYFIRRWEYYAHKDNCCCNPRKCGECGETFRTINETVIAS